MKILIVGGANQGKAAYAQKTYAPLWDEAGINHLHLLLLEKMREEGAVRRYIKQLLEREHWIILCDEVGSGVVPVDAFDRRWREEVGRACCALAKDADIVERVCCGIPMRIKGEGQIQ